MLKSHQAHPLGSPLLNGNTFSEATPLTSTKSSPLSTILSLMRKGHLGDAEVSFGFTEAKKHQYLSCSPTDKTSFLTIQTTSKKNSRQKSLHPIIESSYMISPSGMKLVWVSTSSSQKLITSPDYILPSSCQTALNPIRPFPSPKKQSTCLLTKNQKFAINSTPEPANTDTSAKTAKNQDMPVKIVREGAEEIYGVQPKYLRHNLWFLNLWDQSSVFSPITAEWSLYTPPLPRPLLSELSNPVVQKTIADNLNLFKIVTPIKVDVFESLLSNHPNQPFVQSVCTGLREAAFIVNQGEIEFQKDRFSPPFSPNLLPGMYSMPLYAINKPNSTDLRLVTDHSAGPFSLNSMINCSQVMGFPLDNLCQLGEILLDVRKSIRNVPITMWKSDIAEAYRLLPVHPFWQIKQINTIGGVHCVDHNLAFGSSGSPGIFISFNSLVAWIAKYVKLFDYLANYVDDSSSCDVEGDTLFYAPYNRYLPSHQKQLLDLWDKLGIPHKPHKQLSGSPLTIIGIDVDPNSMTLSLPPSSKARLLNKLSFWASKPPKTSSGSFKLKHWERMAGWFNWALNMSGKHNRDQCIYINNAKSDGVHLLKSMLWTPSKANFVIYCDACPEGLSFWYPDNKSSFYVPTPINVPTEFIFYFEALCVLSALDHIQTCAHRGSQIVIYSDNSNTVNIFQSYQALPAYNHLLKQAVDIIILNDYNLCILHIPGSDNVVTDALSHVKFSVALHHEPLLKLFTFNPPSMVGLQK
ncbi:hypothetical protein BYT27DRAFT_7225943 [Phlegmacium glaucopus]|nr:hypothetical protein BYT27DRAFT_7225943 [Phlegmacium glaucopus]